MPSPADDQVDPDIPRPRSAPRWASVAAFVVAAGVAWGAARVGGVAPLSAVAATLGVGALLAVYRAPILLLHAIIIAGFTGTGLARYVPAPLGLSSDALLLLMLVVILGRGGGEGGVRPLGDPLHGMLAVWIVYCVLGVLMPGGPNVWGWVYAVRGAALYTLLTPLALQVLDTRRQLYGLLTTWIILAVAAGLWGVKQATWGLDRWEGVWLDANRSTHMLAGHLRVFSFLSDSGQYGVVMGYTAFLCGALAMAPIARWLRGLLVIAALVCAYGMAISGTRSASLVLPLSFFTWALISRNLRLGVPTLLGCLAVFGFLRFTYIGQSNYDIQRLRQAVSPTNDASFQVRLDNQKRLIPYLMAHPFGGGVGSAGYWGHRFSPGTFLAELALDSYYVKIAAEGGYVGLALFAGLVVTGGVIGWVRLGRVKDPVQRQVHAAMWAAYVGISVVSYSNQYFGQVPTGFFIYLSWAVFLRADGLDPPRVRSGTSALPA